MPRTEEKVKINRKHKGMFTIYFYYIYIISWNLEFKLKYRPETIAVRIFLKKLHRTRTTVSLLYMCTKIVGFNTVKLTWTLSNIQVTSNYPCFNFTIAKKMSFLKILITKSEDYNTCWFILYIILSCQIQKKSIKNLKEHFLKCFPNFEHYYQQCETTFLSLLTVNWNFT